MIELILPLGLLGLLGIGVLILIYLLKPNYQQKVVSSTYVWKLSLKYKKKRIPVSLLRNILIFICQLLVITACALILARPVLPSKAAEERPEKVIVIDASASMLTVHDQKTRFDRAVEQARSLSEEVYSKDGIVSVILAGRTASFLGMRVGADMKDTLYQDLDALVGSEDPGCTYGAADIDGAMALAESVLVENPLAEVLLYTGTEYYVKGDVEVVNVAQKGEWNAAVLDGISTLEENNYYSFTANVASYGKDADVVVHFAVHGANMNGNDMDYTVFVRCADGVAEEIVYDTSSEGDAPVYSYEYVQVYLESPNDSFVYDNNFFLYGGKKPTVRIQYASSARSNAFNAVFENLRNKAWKNRFEIDYKEVDRNPAIEGFDIYVFEHKLMPEVLPTDGLVIFVDPDPQKLPAGMDIQLGEVKSGDFRLSRGVTHEITGYGNPENIMITSYRRVVQYSESYLPLLYCTDDPVLLVRDEPLTKIAVLSIDTRTADLTVTPEFPTYMYLLLNYFMPETLQQYVYDVNDSVTVNARGSDLDVSGGGQSRQFETVPAKFDVTVPDIYVASQTLLSGERTSENFFVKIPAQQSNIFRQEDSLTQPIRLSSDENQDYDLILYLAGALVGLLLIEWLLHSRSERI